MPFAENPEDGVRIHYEVEGDGPPLVLQHGTGGSLEGWRARGYVDRLRDRFRLLLIDSRGHGESDRPLEQEAYELRNRVLDIGAVMTAEDTQAAHFFGYSMGGWIGYGAAIYMSQRFRSLVIGGFGPVADPYFGRSPEQLVEAGAERAAAQGTPLTASEREVRALVFAETSRFGGAVQALKTTRLPVLLFAGDQDPRHESIRNAEALSERATFFSLPGMDHRGAFEAVDDVVPRVIDFLERVRTD